MVKRFFKSLSEFLESGADFKLVYNTASSFISGSTKRVCILDSSFNPPHLGHLSMATQALFFDYKKNEVFSRIIDNSKDGQQDTNETVLLLLLSVKNADKVVPQPAAFEDRIEMMVLLADHIFKTYNVNTAVGLTDHAKFVDKANAINNSLIQNHPLVKLTFLVGFDTLIRIFNPKYYLPKSIKESLDEFVTRSEFICLTRDDDDYSIEKQIDYLRRIKDNLNNEIPSTWAKSIFLIQSDDATLGVSSSQIRKNVNRNSESGDLLKTIQQYIQENDLYDTTS